MMYPADANHCAGEVMRKPVAKAMVITACPQAASAHASEQGFVLLLPTDMYIAAGVATVALTVVLLAFMPATAAGRLFRPLRLLRVPRPRLRHVASCLSWLVLAALVWLGLAGPRDPLANLLPLTIWTVWWVVLVALQGVLGNHWRWTNPWTGPAALLARVTRARARLRYPGWLGHGPALLSFLAFAALLLADPAPTDPGRLALFVAGYWTFAFVGLLAFGPRWMVRGEGLTVLMRAYGRMALLGRSRGRLAVGAPGWQMLAGPRAGLGLALFILVLLGTGSFDGLNETFWWIGVLGLNPLEFPGRSAVVTQNLTGLVVANSALIAVFAGCLWLGDRLAGTGEGLLTSFRRFAPSVLPIALGYHVAHYITVFLVNGQYVVKALNDPLARGSDLLGLGHVHVTTGFFNTPDTVRLIWLTQAGAVVAGHVVAILLAHALALRAHGSHRRALVGQAPVAAFMVAYTFFGLWLLASPRGL